MKFRKQNQETRDRLDRLGRGVVRAAASPERVAEESAAAPFLYARIRARIAAERARRAEGRDGWLAVLGVARRAVPALALVFAFALTLLLTASPAGPAAPGVVDEALAGAQAAGYERVVFADRAALSGDEVLTTILETTEAQR